MNRKRFTRIVALLCAACGLAARADEPTASSPVRRIELSPEVRERCFIILRIGLRGDEFWPSMHAAEALTLAGSGGEVVRALRDRLPSERDDQRRCGLARELVRSGDRTPLPLLYQILSDPQSTGRVHAAESLYKLGEVGDGKALRAAFARQDNPQLRLMAAAALAHSGDAEALKLLRRELQSDDRSRRNTAAFALARLGSAADVTPLIAALDREKDVQARGFLVIALACLGNERGRRKLAAQLKSADATVRALSADGAGRCRAVECEPELIRLLDDPVLDVRIRAAQALLQVSLPPAPR